MRHVIAQADRAAAGRTTILLVGDTGTGKEQLARRIHDVSPRAKKPFVALNCGALPDGLIESELFGHEKGAFTGADRRHLGRFELAEGGTLFLDEIGELPAAAQVKLLRVLQEHEITRLGGTDAVRVNVRVIAATHRDLLAEVRAGRFREDLYFRVHVVPIILPPLRDRPEDVLPLSLLFLDRYARELGRPARTITPDAMERLRAHSWPGNVRELQNVIERVMVLGDDGPIRTSELEGLLPREGAVTNRATEVPAPDGAACRRSLAMAPGRITVGQRAGPGRTESDEGRGRLEDQPRAAAHPDETLRFASRSDAIIRCVTAALSGTARLGDTSVAIEATPLTSPRPSLPASSTDGCSTGTSPYRHVRAAPRGSSRPVERSRPAREPHIRAPSPGCD